MYGSSPARAHAGARVHRRRRLHAVVHADRLAAVDVRDDHGLRAAAVRACRAVRAARCAPRRRAAGAGGRPRRARRLSAGDPARAAGHGRMGPRARTLAGRGDGLPGAGGRGRGAGRGPRGRAGIAALDYVRESAAYAYRSQWTPSLAVPPRAAITGLLPYFFGSGVSTWSDWQFGVTSIYVGLVPWVSLPLAALSWRRSPTLFFGGLAGVVAAVHYGAPLVSALAKAPGMTLGTNLRLMPLLPSRSAAGRARADAWRAARGGRVRPRMVCGSGRRARRHRAGRSRLAATIPERPRCGRRSPSTARRAVRSHRDRARPARVARRRPRRWAVVLAAVQVASLAPLAATYHPARHARLYPRPPPSRASADPESRVLKPALRASCIVARGACYDGLGPRRTNNCCVLWHRTRLAGYLENTVAARNESLSPATVLASPVRDWPCALHRPGAGHPGAGARPARRVRRGGCAHLREPGGVAARVRRAARPVCRRSHRVAPAARPRIDVASESFSALRGFASRIRRHARWRAHRRGRARPRRHHGHRRCAGVARAHGHVVPRLARPRGRRGGAGASRGLRVPSGQPAPRSTRGRVHVSTSRVDGGRGDHPRGGGDHRRPAVGATPARGAGRRRRRAVPPRRWRGRGRASGVSFVRRSLLRSREPGATSRSR